MHRKTREYPYRVYSSTERVNLYIDGDKDVEINNVDDDDEDDDDDDNDRDDDDDDEDDGISTFIRNSTIP